MNKITVITPIYNRKKLIKQAYESLKNQTNKNFEWLIVDDGSTDKVEEEITEMQNEGIIKINYIYKTNGGKHTALNVAFKNLSTELAIILDSDDILISKAIEEILTYWDKYKSMPKIAGMVFLRGYNTEKAMTNRFSKDEYIGNYNKEIINAGLVGDKAEVFRSDILQRYSFPEFKTEKFLGEGFLWSKISRKYDMVFINKIIYIGNYLEDGLTKAGKKLRINNPLGGMEHSKEYMDKSVYCLKVRIKNIILYNIYYFFARDKYSKAYMKKYQLINKFLNILLKPISFLIYKYWKRKY